MSKEAALSMLSGSPAPVAPELGVVGPEVVTAPEVKAEPTKSDSDRWAAVARREAKAVKEQQEAQALKKEVEAERAKLKPVWEKYQEYEATKAKDPVAALRILGFTETDIVNFMADQPEKPEPTVEERAAKAAKEETEKLLQADRDLQAKKAKEEQDAKDLRVIDSFKKGISDSLESAKDTFEYCAFHGKAAEDLAYELTLQVVTESQGADVLTPKEALEMVENYYEEEDKAMSTLKKRQPKAPEAAAEPEKKGERSTTLLPAEKQDTGKPLITKSRTLTNAATASAASAKIRAPETPNQKRERLEMWLKTGVKPS